LKQGYIAEVKKATGKGSEESDGGGRKQMKREGMWALVDLLIHKLCEKNFIFIFFFSCDSIRVLNIR
jgi:hypothetical protein